MWLSPSPNSAAMGLKNEFEIAMVNEHSVFKPLKFYCISKLHSIRGNFQILRYQELTVISNSFNLIDQTITFAKSRADLDI